MPPSHERRRAEDVYRAIETDVFPRIDTIEKKITATEGAVHELQLKGCAHREGDLRRTQAAEENMTRIFDKIDHLGDSLTVNQVAVTKQIGDINTEMTRKIGGVRIWVLTSCVIVLLATLSFIAKDFITKLF